MADYSGRGPSENGEYTSGQYYQEVKWSNGKFLIDDSNGNVVQQETLINSDHRRPSYTVSFKLNASKQLTATFIRSKNEDGTQPRSKDYFCYRVGIEVWDDAHAEDVLFVQCNGDPNWNHNWAWGNNYGNGQDETITADLSGLNLPIYIRAVCAGCYHNKYAGFPLVGFAHYTESPKYGDSGSDGGGAYKIIQGHTHIQNPNPPIIVKASGTTITVKCDPNDAAASHRGYVRDTSNNTWYDTDHIFTGYKQNSVASFSSRRYCGDDCTNDGANKYFESENRTKAKTWNIDAGCSLQSANRLVFYVNHSSNIIGSTDTLANSTNIICALYGSDADRSSDTNRIETVIVNNGSSDNVTFNSLRDGVTYYFRAWSDGIKDDRNNLDNFINVNAKTFRAFNVSRINMLSSATTVRASIKLELNESTRLSSTIKCNSISITLTNITNSSYTHVVGFTNLQPDTTYEVEFTVEDEHGNKYHIVDYILTKIANLEILKTSSSALKVRPKSNMNKEMSIALYKENEIIRDWQNINPLDEKIFSNLITGTDYICKVKVNNCYAFNEGGEITEYNDSLFERSVKTQLICAEIMNNTIYSYQNAISFIAFPYLTPSANSNLKNIINIDPITEFMYRISNIKIQPMIESGYCTPANEEEREIPIPATGFLFFKEARRIPVINLDYYTQYKIFIEIYDGYNKVWSEPIIAHTAFPYSTMYIDGEWKSVKPYIYKDGDWIPAVLYLNSDDRWREPDSSVYIYISLNKFN